MNYAAGKYGNLAIIMGFAYLRSYYTHALADGLAMYIYASDAYIIEVSTTCLVQYRCTALRYKVKLIRLLAHNFILRSLSVSKDAILLLLSTT